MLRTDRRDYEEDKEGEQKEWRYGSKAGYKDPPGDDEVDILIRPNRQLLVAYRNPDPEDEDGKEMYAAMDAKGPVRRAPASVVRAEATSPEHLEVMDRLTPRQPEHSRRWGILQRQRARRQGW